MSKETKELDWNKLYVDKTGIVIVGSVNNKSVRKLYKDIKKCKDTELDITDKSYMDKVIFNDTLKLQLQRAGFQFEHIVGSGPFDGDRWIVSWE